MIIWLTGQPGSGKTTLAKKILTKYKKQMKSMVNTLIEKETIDRDIIQQLFNSVPKVKLLGTGSNIRLATS